MQYAVVSALLALVYFGMVILLQSVFNSVSGQQSSIAIVISTLVIAALFAPLRRRIQDVIDRRFFRKKYDAQQVLAQFAQTARDETDMDKLMAELMRVVQETMQPETVSVWLRNSKGMVLISDLWLRRLGWVTAVFSLIILTVSIIMLWLPPGQTTLVWQYVQVRTISELGAPVLGLLILNKQPRQRIGWLWIIYGLAAGLGSLGQAIYFYGGSQPTGYSALEYFLLWVTQPANVTILICL